MRDDVMAEEIEVRASRELAAFRAPEQLPVKAARALDIVNREREVEKRVAAGCHDDLV